MVEEGVGDLKHKKDLMSGCWLRDEEGYVAPRS